MMTTSKLRTNYTIKFGNRMVILHCSFDVPETCESTTVCPKHSVDPSMYNFFNDAIKIIETIYTKMEKFPRIDENVLNHFMRTKVIVNAMEKYSNIADEMFDIFTHFTGLVEKKRRFLNQVILRKMNNLERSVKQLMALIRKGELTSEEFINLLSKDMVMVGFPTAVDQLVATKHSSAGGCGAELYCYKRRLKRFQKPAVISSPKDALAATFLELSTPPSKLRKHQEYLKLADGFSACDLACFFKELLDGEVPDELKDAQHRMNLLFFNPEGFNKESQFRCDSKLAVAPPDNMRGLCPEFKVENRPKCIFSNAVIEVAAVLADRGLIKRKSQLCRLFAPDLDTSYASRLHTNSKGYKLKYFDCEMQTLLDLMIMAYMPKE